MRRAGLAFAVLCAATFFLGPFLWQALTSLRPERELASLGLPSHLTLESYRAAFRAQPFGAALFNSFLVASTTTALCLAIGASAAFALARLPFRGKSALLGASLAISMFPPIATVSPLYLIVRSLGLRDTPAGLVLPYTTFALPLTLWLLTSFFQQIPEELYRAARVDGASPARIFFSITLPLLRPVLLVALIFRALDAFRVFDAIYVLTAGGPGNSTETLSIYAYKTLMRTGDFGYGSTLAVATFACVLAMGLLFLRLLGRPTAGGAM